MTGSEQTTVHISPEVIITAGCRLHCCADLFVVGAAVISNSLTGDRQHEHHIVEPAKETVQDYSCTVN